MRKYFFKYTVPLALVGALALPLAACGGNDAVATAVVIPDEILVNTISPEVRDISITGEYIGVIEPNRQVAVLPRLPGEVQSVYFNVGDMVNAGDLLLTIDTTDLMANIAALEAQLAVQDATVQAAQTGLQLVDGSAMQSQLLAAEGGVAQAEAGIAQAEQNLEQAALGIEQAQMGYDMALQAYRDTTVLFNAGVVSRSTFEQAEAGYTNAAAALERALSGYTMAEIGLNQARLGHAQAAEGLRILQNEAAAENRRRAQDGVQQANAARNIIIVNLETTIDRLGDAQVRAPISGIIEMRNVDPFGFASPQAPAFLISEQDSMAVTFRVPRAAAAYLQIGDPVQVQDGGMLIPGTITELATMVDHSGLMTVSAGISNPPESLLSGTSVRVIVDTERADNVPVLPLVAIHHERGVPHVFVAENNIARLVAVETGIFDADYIQIVSGIDNNAQVITTWSSRLADGVAVEVVRHGG